MYIKVLLRDRLRQFQLADYVECKGGKLEDGMLNVELEYNPPESKKPKQIK